MKHAICVIGYGDSSVLQETINILDDEDIDFFIHWDAKYAAPKLNSVSSSIYLVSNPEKVYWGTDSMILAELKVLLLADSKYSYVHLISSSDMPLMTKDYFKSFFTNDVYIGFDNGDNKKNMDRLKYFLPIRKLDIRKHRKITRLLKAANISFGVNRLQSDFVVEKGPQWFSIRTDLLKGLLERKYYKHFLNSYIPDEEFVQSYFSDFKKETNLNMTDNEQALRYIDWIRGNPYIFRDSDTDELVSLVNTRFAFARKITEAQLPRRVFEKYRQNERKNFR